MPYTTHRPTARVLDIMQLLSTSKEVVASTEIATAISVQKYDCSHYPTLCERRFITQHGSNKRYGRHSASSSGPPALAGYGHTGALQIPDEAHVSATSEACQLGVLVGGDGTLTRKRRTPEPIRLFFVGKRLPLTVRLSGKPC